MLVSDLIRYILLRVREEEGNLGKTKLIKLLYLVDVEYYRRYEKTLTGLQWRFHHYGPYAAELEPLLKRLPDLEEDEVTTSKGHRAKTYTTSTNLDQLEEKIDFSVRAHVDTIIKQWALDDLYTILDYVYYETEPMYDAKRGEVLDFKKIQPAQPTAPPSPKLVVPKKQLQEEKRRFKELMAAKKGTQRLRLVPPPPYDDIYYEGMRIMNAQESRSSK